MGALKRWKTLGTSGEFYKFDTEGQMLEGTWQGTQTGKYGDNGRVQQYDGKVVLFTLNTTLKDLIHVKPGCDVKITYLGKATAKNGNQYKAFNVQVSEDAEVDENETSTEVPF